MPYFVTRKYRLHWVDHSPSNQQRLKQFFLEYVDKANELIRYLFSLKPQYDRNSSDAFQNLFANTGTIASNHLFTTSLNLKSFNRQTGSANIFKQRTMRMLAEDVYYVLRNHFIRVSNLQRIFGFLLQLSITNSDSWERFMKFGRVSHSDSQFLRKLLHNDCFGKNQSMSRTYLTNHLRQLRNLVFLHANPKQIKGWKEHSKDNIDTFVYHLKLVSSNLESLIGLPERRALTCSLPAKDNLWKVSETTKTFQFTFKPIVRQSFTFQLRKRNLYSRTQKDPAILRQSLFDHVPTLQYNRKGIILCQPIPTSVTPTVEDTSMIMGIDLGLKTPATLSIGTEVKESKRIFITNRKLLSTKVDLQTGHLVPLPDKQSGGNIWRRLYNLRKVIRQVQSKINSTPKGISTFALERRRERHWDNMQNLHCEMRNQLSHKIVCIARANHVGFIKFEDLRWATHNSKRKRGGWITQHQLHWLHGKIIAHTMQLAHRYGIRVQLVNARFSSQIDATQVHNTGLGKIIMPFQAKNDFKGILGTRRGKHFYGCVDPSGHRKQIDADLNAARNIRMRVPMPS